MELTSKETFERLRLPGSVSTSATDPVATLCTAALLRIEPILPLKSIAKVKTPATERLKIFLFLMKIESLLSNKKINSYSCNALFSITLILICLLAHPKNKQEKKEPFSGSL